MGVCRLLRLAAMTLEYRPRQSGRGQSDRSMDNVTAARPSSGIDAIPGYRVIGLLNQGGMGGVYLAEDENLKRQVAIKLINPELSNEPEAIRRFRREALIIARISSPSMPAAGSATSNTS